VRAVWTRWFADHDVLLVPVAAFPHDQAGDIGTRSLVIDGEVRAATEVIGAVDRNAVRSPLPRS
jgi:hypothetical protein